MARRTPLYEAHLKLNGRMVDFAGWEMPVQYSGVIQEHEAVRNAARSLGPAMFGTTNRIRTAMMAMTTISSRKVKPRFARTGVIRSYPSDRG